MKNTNSEGSKIKFDNLIKRYPFTYKLNFSLSVVALFFTFFFQLLRL
jgi:hypothetical protein